MPPYLPQKLILPCFIIHLKDKGITLSHSHRLLYQHFINRNPDTLPFLRSYFYSSRSRVIVVHGMAKLTIGHLHCALPTNKPKPFIRRNQRFFRTYIISHICLYIAYNPLQKYNLSLKPANILRFFYHYHDKGLVRVILIRRKNLEVRTKK